jgi:CHAT domain-containing protein/tetratricopeptide (TPR) repeat protein
MGKYRNAIGLYGDAYDLKLKQDDKSGAGFSKSNIGQAYWNLGLYDSAILSHREAIKLRKEGNDLVGTAFSYEKTGGLWKEIGNIDSALFFYQISQDLYVSNNDTTDKLASVKESVGQLYYDAKNYEKAIKYYQDAANIYEQIGDGLGIANAYFNLGLCLYNVKSYPKAWEFLSEAKKQYQQMGDKENTMYALINLALVQWVGENDFAKAEELMGEALLLAKESNSLTNQGYTFNQIGVLKQNQGRFDVAKQYFDSSLFAYSKSGDYSGKGYTNINLGLYYIEKGEFKKSQQKFWLVANEAIEKKNYLLASNAFNSLADYYNLVGEYDSAKYIVSRGLELNNELKNEYVEAGNYISLGNTYNYLANYKLAVKYYFKADSIYQKAKDRFSRATPVNNIGTIFFHQGDYRNALIQFNEVYEQLNKINYKGDFLVLALSNMGEVYLEDGLLSEADKWLTMSLETAQQIGNTRGINGANLLLGKLKLKQEKYEEASTYLNAAYKDYSKSGEKERIIEAATFLGKLYIATNKNNEAKTYLQKAIEVANETGNTRYLWEPLYISATINLEQKDTIKALTELKQAVDILENIKGNIAGGKKNLASFAKAQNKYKLYQDLVELLVGQNDVKTAFFYQEKANITGLLEQTRGGGSGTTRSNELLGGLEEETTAKELELKIDGYYAELIKEKSKPQAQQSASKIESLQKLINVSETNFQEFIDSAVKANGGENVNFSSTINPRDLDDARFSLGDEDAVVEYLLTDDQLLIFVATNSSLNARKVKVDKEQLSAVINEFNKQLSTSKTEENIVVENSKKLYQIFIAPITDLIEGHTRLALVPTGVLYKLPMQALATEKGGKLEYLIEKYSVTYINNIKFVYQAQAGGKPKLKILAFGNADKTLSNAEKEVNTIVNIFPTTTAFVQDSATEDKAKLMIKKYNVVHFAIHGRLDPVKFENSYLALAPNTKAGDDGKFTMNEIRQIRSLRNVKLLVLSACNTAVKEEKIEGWLNTPANEFILKGVNSVIATQWQVHDEATGILMGHFYKNLQAGMSFSEALKNAQLKLASSEKFSHPYYWSAFETIGKW